jgi:hypothetical protein
MAFTDTADTGDSNGGEDDVEALLSQAESDAPETEDGGDEEEGLLEQPQKQAKAPLPPAEVEKRYRQTQAALKQERDKAKRERSQYEATINAVLAKVGQPLKAEPEPEAEIDPEVDPVGALKQLLGAKKGFEQERTQEQERAKQQQQRQRAEAVFWDGVERAEAEFSAEQPDYEQAQQYYLTGRLKEYMAFGVDEKTARNAVRMEFMQASSAAMNNGVNPAQALYAAAQARGYAPQQANGKATDRVAQINRAQGMSRSLSNGQGGGRSGDMTAKDIGKLEGAAFDKAMDKFLKG